MCKNWYGGGNSLPIIGEDYFVSFSSKDLFKKAELVKGIWVSGDGLTGLNSNARSWAIPCKTNTTYSITRKSETNRGNVASIVGYPNGSNKIQSCKEITNNTCTITTGATSDYLIIFFAASTEEYNTVKWIVKEVK